MKRGSTTCDNLEYVQTCKAIRWEMKGDILAFDEKQVLKAIEKSKSLKHARHKQCLGKKQLISIMEEDGTWIHNRDCIVTCCVEFYQELYRSRRLQMDTMEPQQPDRLTMDDTPLVILPAEVDALIKELDCSKAPGEDNITAGVLQDSSTNVLNCTKFEKHGRTWWWSCCTRREHVRTTGQSVCSLSFTKHFHTSSCNGYCRL